MFRLSAILCSKVSFTKANCKTVFKDSKMLDLLKLSTLDISLINDLENHNLLEWVKSEDKINLFDFEVIKTKIVKQYKGILFCFYSNRVDILFKPHYYFNNNVHNANDFKLNDCINVILELKNTFKIDLQLLKVVNIEFGLNVLSPIDIKKLITFLLYHEKNEFKTDVGLAFSKKSFRANPNGTINNYKIIKAYAKGLQFPQYSNINTFRFEVKSKQSKYINQLGIYTANDLLNFDCYLKMAHEIINEFDKVLLLDCETDFKSLTGKEQAKITNYLNTLTWFIISQDGYRNRFNKEKTKYYNLVNKIENNLKKQLDKIIFDKLEYLKTGAISTHKENVKTGAYSNIYKGGICTQKDNQKERKNDEVEKALCRITNLDISMQKEYSILISHSGLKFYFENDKITFDKLKKKYLSTVWQDASFETQIKEMAHNIRNTNSNQQIKQRRLYPQHQIQLFG